MLNVHEDYQFELIGRTSPENDFRHCYGIFLQKYHSETTWSTYVQSSFAAITRHSDNSIWNDTL